ncbi:MAG TPA: hypothetical protein VIF60_24380 [Burkholderiaceae bacterium]|jgi:hypothetical protein
MSNVFQSTAITVTATGVSQATSGTSAGGLLPTTQNGKEPRYIRVAATAAACFRIGVGAQTALATDLQIQPGDAVLLAVPEGYNNFAVVQVSVAGVVQISALENM